MKGALKIVIKWVIVICMLHTTLTSQSNYRLLELTEQKTEEYVMKIGMNSGEKDKFTSIIVKYDRELANAINSTSEEYQKDWIRINNEKNTAISKLLGSQRYKLYKILKEIEIDGLLESHTDIVNALSSNSELNAEILEYRVENILPILSKMHRNWTGQMSVDQYYVYKRLREKYYEFVKSDEMKKDNSNRLFTDYLSSDENASLKALLNREMETLEDTYRALIPFRKKWESDQRNITSQFVSENALVTLDKVASLEAIYQITKREYLMHFIMLVPEDQANYILNLDMILHEQQYFEKLLTLLK